MIDSHRPLIAIHQPNYVPWLGYFYKIARADVMIFLDDVQYSKNNYINRVQIVGLDQMPRWLTIPVSVQFGQPILAVQTGQADWVKRHLDKLKGCYRQASQFSTVWPDVQAIYESLTELTSLARVNATLIQGISRQLNLQCEFKNASGFALNDQSADDRLVALVALVAANGCYFSGKGAAKYQDPEKFRKAGLGFQYSDFQHPVYSQWGEPFASGASILDAVFHLG